MVTDFNFYESGIVTYMAVTLRPLSWSRTYTNFYATVYSYGSYKRLVDNNSICSGTGASRSCYDWTPPSSETVSGREYLLDYKDEGIYYYKDYDYWRKLRKRW